MCGLRAVGILRVLELCRIADILHHLASQCKSQSLDASADTKDRYLTVVGQLGYEKFRQVALAIDDTES